MKNSDMPAMPAGEIDRTTPKGRDPRRNYTRDANGLTKREELAARAMQAIMSNPYWNEHGDYGTSQVASSAIQYADALLAELERAK